MHITSGAESKTFMKAALVQSAGQSPVYADFPRPVSSAEDKLIKVSAAALSPVTKSRASGRHYSSSSQFPFVAGVDGVGQLEDGTWVYFALPEEPHGGMAEFTLVSADRCVALPEGLDYVTAAAIANPGMSSWAAYKERAKLKAGETVLINGATGTAGRLAVQIAKHLGAKKVIATGRNPESLRTLASLGADVTIPLVEDKAAMEGRFREEFASGIDVVIDYLWGKSAEALLAARAKVGGRVGPTRYVEVGAGGGAEISLPGAVLRSSAIELMGSGIGSVPSDRLVACISELLRATIPGGFKIAIKTVPLSEVETAWSPDDSAARTVFIIQCAATSDIAACELPRGRDVTLNTPLPLNKMEVL
jgi:NADPH:quinone reductase-like Zn-dependent oxidoreductase